LASSTKCASALASAFLRDSFNSQGLIFAIQHNQDFASIGVERDGVRAGRLFPEH
jgi:hypothetical protein